MPHTDDISVIHERTKSDKKFRQALLREAVESFLNGDLETSMPVLRGYIYATAGFQALEEQTDIPAKSLMRMLSPKGKPSAANLASILTALQKNERVHFQLADGHNTKSNIAKQPLDLSDFDDKLLDGLEFCRKVYELLDQIKAEPDGLQRLRSHRTKPSNEPKLLTEELLPIARFLQMKYNAVDRIMIRWKRGKQPYDGILAFSGENVRLGLIPEKLFIEVTTSEHENSYLVREEMETTGGSFGPNRIKRDQKTKKPISEAHASDSNLYSMDFAQRIIKRIQSKSLKNYHPKTILVVNCLADRRIDYPRWITIVQEVERSNVCKTFREVFLIEQSDYRNVASIYGYPADKDRKSKLES